MGKLEQTPFCFLPVLSPRIWCDRLDDLKCNKLSRRNSVGYDVFQDVIFACYTRGRPLHIVDLYYFHVRFPILASSCTLVVLDKTHLHNIIGMLENMLPVISSVLLVGQERAAADDSRTCCRVLWCTGWRQETTVTSLCVFIASLQIQLKTTKTCISWGSL